MPWWLNMLVFLAEKFGVPWVLAHIPGLSQDIKDEIQKLIELIAGHKAEVTAQKRAIAKVCSGVACPSDLKDS